MKAGIGNGAVTMVPAFTADVEARRRPAALARRKRELVLQHRGEDVNGRLPESLAELGSRPVIVRADPGEGLPDPAPFRLAVVLGSESFAKAAERGSLDAELDWIRRADEAGTALLGVGHGARALAFAFGAKVQPAPRPQRGWTMIATKVPHQIAGGPWLTWQQDVLSLPADAEVLAENRLGPQAFRIGRHLGVQFHPEATPASVVRWARETPGTPDARSILDGLGGEARAAVRRSRQLFETFLRSVSCATTV
jgi:GMP synthase (glutamine-hydrolysing)